MIGRRQLLAGTMGAGMHGAARPRRPDQAEVPPSRGLGGGMRGNITKARLVIVSGPNDGVFVYAGAPALGDLVASVAAMAGTDTFGNAYLAGFTTYVNNMPAFPNWSATNLLNGSYSVYQAPTSAGPWTLIDAIAIGQSAALGPTHSILLGNGTGSALQLVDQVFGGITAARPGALNSKEIWHQVGAAGEPAFLNSWANAAGNVTCQFRLVASPPNTVEVIGALSSAAATAATFVQLPAAYHPASQQQFSCGATAGVTAGHAPYVQCDTAGNLSIQSGALGVGDTYVFHGFVSLDA